MELRHLRYFTAVAGTENVSRAALQLHVSQPALSRQVRDLEDELGFQLFERGARSVRLTDAGRAFLMGARAVLQRAEEAVQAARTVATRVRGELHVGYAPTLTARILPPALRAFQATMPGVRVRLHDLSTEEMLAGLREGRLQVAFLVPAGNTVLRGLRFEELTRDPLRLLVAPHHPLARRRSVPVAEAAREPFIAYSRKEYPDYHDLLAAVFSPARKRLRIAEEHDGVSSLVSAVEAGSGVALVSESIAFITGTRLRLLPLVPEPEPLVIGMAFPKNRMTVTMEKFSNCVRQCVKAGP